MTTTTVFTLVGLALLLIVFFRRKASWIASEDARKLVDEGALLLDVRTPGEFGSGHIDGARNIPVSQLQARLEELGDKAVPVVVYCRSGARSSRAATLLRASGFAQVHDLGPGSRW